MSNRDLHIGRWIAAGLAVLGLAAIFYHVVVDNMPKGEVRRIDGYTAWPVETLRVAETLPVQEGGRIKPLSTYAGFTMLSLHGARSMKIAGANGATLKIKPTAWMLDALFRPQFAIEQPTFRVDNSAALEAIRVPTRGKRDRYSYTEIEPGRAKLVELAQAYEQIEAKKRDPLQSQIVDLATNVRIYEGLLGYFGFARGGILLRGDNQSGATDRRAELSALMTTAPELRTQIAQAQKGGSGISPRMRDLIEQIVESANFARFGLFPLPPANQENKTWQSAGDAIMAVMSGQADDPGLAIADIASMESAARSVADEGKFRENLLALRDRLKQRAETRNEGRWLDLEAGYHRQNPFVNALVFFLIGTLSALGMWVTGRSRIGTIFSWVTGVTTATGLLLCLVAIAIRCVIMQRPPVGNLYDTIVFIGASVVVFALLIEVLVRRRFALGAAPILGTIFIILARRFELGDANDHMDPLVAVLDSNFWLTTHVITITLGYSAGLLGAFLSTGYVLLRGLGLDHGDRSMQRSLTRAVYGMLCFTLFLSLVGTVLGGIWANYSWGRFWGWDPKENGALLIVLWTLAILHARLGGFLNEWGLHFASLFTAVVVTFSWWHVNFLGVGLHNYGFTAGKNAIWAFYGAMLAVMILGVLAMWIERRRSGQVVQ